MNHKDHSSTDKTKKPIDSSKAAPQKNAQSSSSYQVHLLLLIQNYLNRKFPFCKPDNMQGTVRRIKWNWRNFADKYIYFIRNITVYYFVANVWLILAMRLFIALSDFSAVSLSLFGFIVNDFLPIRFWSSFIAASFSYSWTSSTRLNDIFEPRFSIWS